MVNLLLPWIGFNRAATANWFPVSLLIQTSGRALVSLAFEKAKASRCFEDPPFVGRGEQTL
jgi:hypothetical protein